MDDQLSMILINDLLDCLTEHLIVEKIGQLCIILVVFICVRANNQLTIDRHRRKVST